MARILGIDIDRSALRTAVIKTAFGRVEIERYLQIPLGSAPATPGRLPEVHEALANVLRALGKPPDVAVSCLDGEHASIRVVELPTAAAKRVSEVLPFELESMLPFDMADAVVDYQPIATTGAQQRWLATAVPKQHVRDHLSHFAGTAAEPREVAVGAAALDGLRTVCPDLATGTVALLELSDGAGNFCVLEAGRCAFARTLSMERTPSARGDAEFWQAVKRTLAAYRASGGAAPTTLHLCGPGASMDIATWLSSELSLPVVPLQLPAALGSVGNEVPAFARALALAARAASPGKRINLRLGEFATTRGRTELAAHLSLASICGVILLLTMVFSLKARQSVLLDEQHVLRSELANVTESAFGKAERDVVAVEALLAGPQTENPLPRFDAYDALAAISEAVPPEITHELRHVRIDLADEKKEGKLELQGALGTIDQRDQIVARLEQHGCFAEIERGRTSSGRIAGTISYQVESKVACPGEATQSKKHKTRGQNE
jgi:general secretion pathway protein L